MKTMLETWSPETTDDREAVLLELESVLASQHFCNSKRYPALLRYIVERTLEGKADWLKERTLGVEVFHRPADYDTNADTVVRYTAGEVRKRLSLYYHHHQPTAGFQISLPVGSYAPEFLKEHEAAPQALELPPFPLTATQPSFPAIATPALAPPVRPHARALWPLLALLLVAVVGLGFIARLALKPRSAMDQFWTPMLHDQTPTVICIGGNVFNENNFSGTMTAGKDIEYPFVSMQIASGIARVGGLLERLGDAFQIQSSASTPLSDLRERPVVLLGAYNNPWTMRLLKPLRFRFPPEPFEGIVDADHPGRSWTRDRTQPYASTDDYALIARFRDATTGSMVVALAGLGRNGTEAAAQFVTSPHYMQLLKDRAGRNLADGNIEVVLKINVIGGKTGAPTIEEVYTW